MADSTDNALKPCPFCGGKAEIEQYGDNRISTIVACTECGCRLENGEAFRHGTFWNTRADLAPDPLADPRVVALVDIVKRTTNCLDEITGDDWDGDIDQRKVRALIHENRAALAAFDTGGKTDGNL